PEAGAALPLVGLTAWRAAMTRAGLKSGEKVLVTGIGGGVATLSLQLALAHGCEVWVTSSKAEKIEQAKRHGAKGGFLYTEPKWGKQAVNAMGGADVIIDGAGGPGFSELVTAAAPGGRIAVYGSTAGNWPELGVPKLFFKQLSVVATTMGSAREFAAMLAFVAEHRVTPFVDKAFSLADAPAAFAHLAAGGQFGKVVVRP
ncbi:MAG: zinc-binding dehydrogenase, partial [Myxococcota bacterium]